MTPDLSDSALFWDAMRYVLGELTPAETAAFEERLAHDEQACAAVADAVTLSAGLQSAAPVAASHPAGKVASTKSRGWLAVSLCGVAAALSGIALLSAWKPLTPSHHDLAAVELLDRWVADNHHGFNGEHDDSDLETEVLDESLAAPHWLLNAVELTAARKLP